MPYWTNFMELLKLLSESPRLLSEDPKKRAYARIWMASTDDFFPAVFVAGVGHKRGFSEDKISEALEKLKAALGALEERLRDREYLADKFSLADIISDRLESEEQAGEARRGTGTPKG